MYTEYACHKCRKVFTLEELPNMNKKHSCGEWLNIVKHRDETLPPDYNGNPEDLWDDWHE